MGENTEQAAEQAATPDRDKMKHGPYKKSAVRNEFPCNNRGNRAKFRVNGDEKLGLF